jgi:hypothetical protein
MFDVARLGETLSHFYMDARTKSGDLYKATTLTNTRHALNRYLKSPPYLKKNDIISSPEFSEADANRFISTLFDLGSSFVFVYLFIF